MLACSRSTQNRILAQPIREVGLTLLERGPPDWAPFETQCLIVGALLLAGCFLAGQNIDYRGIYFVLVMPGLLVLRRSASAVEVRRFLARMTGAVVFVAWEEVIRSIFSAAASALPNVLRPRAEALFWLGRELVWWWLVAGLAAIVLCHMRQLPLVADTGAALAKARAGAAPIAVRLISLALPLSA